MSSVRIGLIAEDRTDIDVIKVLAQRIVPGKISWFVQPGGGCGSIQRKGRRWLADFARRQATHAILLQDLDRARNGELKNEAELQASLELIASTSQLTNLICIPVEELEAWFWACPDVLTKVARVPAVAKPEPHRIPRPKEALERLSRDSARRPRYSTNDNAALAAVLNLDRCAASCPSFERFRSFLLSAVASV